MIALISSRELRLVLDIPKDSYLFESFKFSPVSKPGKWIGRLDPVLHMPIVDKDTGYDVSHNDDDDSSYQQQRQRKHDIEKYSGCDFNLLLLDVLDEDGG
jgi:hypothetical protein